MIKLDESFREKNIFNILPFFNSWDLGFVSNFFYIFDRFLPMRSGSVDSLIPIFFDTYPDSASQNFADPTNPDL